MIRNRFLILCCVGLLLAWSAVAPDAAAIDIDWVTVGDPNNVDDPSSIYGSFGAVSYEYQIGQYEVTNTQYVAMLSAVAAVGDTNGLYSASSFGITQTGAGTGGDPFVYAVDPNHENRPVNFVGVGDSMRFANWLHNGQPTGSQDGSTTEDGAYDMSLGANAVRKAGAQVFLPSEDEWYKAAYYKGGGTNAGYWAYTTGSDTVPGTDLTETSVPGNNANYNDGTVPIDAPYFLTEVGEFELSGSPYGTFDQGGNVWEWNEKLYIPSPPERGMRGGGYDSIAAHMAIDFFVPYFAEEPFGEFQSIGFRVAAAREGDFNFDDVVNGLDFLKWQRGETPGGGSQAELALWETNYGAGVALSASSTAVPEPATLLMLVVGLVAGVTRRVR